MEKFWIFSIETYRLKKKAKYLMNDKNISSPTY